MGRGFMKIGCHMLMRGAILFLTLVIAVYATILIINMGGELDKMRKAEITFAVASQIATSPEAQGLPASVLRELIDQEVEFALRAQGLDRPFLIRSVGYLTNAITLRLGRSEVIISDKGSRQVRHILTERLAPTLVLFGTTSLVLFFIGVFAALYLSQHYGSLLDRAVIALAPTSAAPGWFYALFLILIFASVLRVLPWGRMVAAPPPPDTLGYALSVLRHMVLPVTAMVMGAIFSNIYSWRTFFLIYSSEDYVELARAKGLSNRAVERRYIMRPTLPPIITSFLLMIITMWMGAIILETVFNWPGLGRLLFQAIGANDTPVIVGSVVVYGYLLALTVFLLDFIYAIVDPRVRVGAGQGGR